MFCKTMGCSWRYAKKILYHIQEGTTESLLVRDSRKDFIKATEWPMKLAQFVKQPENSRACPSETVSIAYRVRVQKYILNKKRGDVIEDFKQKNPECKFSKQILNREWPQNVVTPSTRDLNRNVCPIHSNARRIEKCLKKHGLLADTPSSCRLMSAQRMCQKVGVNAIDPLSWKKECVYSLYLNN